MAKKAIRDRIAKLRQEIAYHDYRYYVLDDPILSDYDYDQLYRQLVDLEKAHPDLITHDSPTQRVGGRPLTHFKTVHHIMKMLSLDNTYNEHEVENYFNRTTKSLGKKVNYEVSLKVDGVAVALSYRKGIFVLGATRGDGINGDDITQNLRTIKSIPLTLLHSKGFQDIDVRGEVFFSKQAFHKLNEQREKQGEPEFANPRNAAAGTLKLLDPVEVAQRNLDIFIHTIPRQPDSRYTSHYDALQRLAQAGLKIIPHLSLCKGPEQVFQKIEYWRDKRSTLAYEVDGLVIKVDGFASRERLGTTVKSPRWAIAFKYPALQSITRLVAIQLQVGRTGRITPVAQLEPVHLSGSTVSRATLHNEDEIQRKGIMINDFVIIEKGGEIIPKVIGVVKERRTGKEQPFHFPKNCPVCNQTIIRLPDEADWRCVNASCPAQLKGKILHFSSRQAMDIKGLGKALVDQLVDAGHLQSIDDIYNLTEKKITNMERMAEKSARNLMQAIERSKTCEFRRVIFAVGIPNVGINAANLLVDEFRNIERLMQASSEVLSAIPGIGDVIAQSIIEYFANKKNRKMIMKLRSYGLRFQEDNIQQRSGHLKGKVFVFTGELSHMTRDQARETVLMNGGRVSSSISVKTDFCVVGKNPGAKLQKALKSGIAIITDREFEELVQGG